eukprot:7370789-Lingulodinium_polyedra.AAC.1
MGVETRWHPSWSAHARNALARASLRMLLALRSPSMLEHVAVVIQEEALGKGAHGLAPRVPRKGQLLPGHLPAVHFGHGLQHGAGLIL